VLSVVSKPSGPFRPEGFVAANSESKKPRLPEPEWRDNPTIPFADYVQVTTSPDVGSILTFAQRIRAEEKAQTVSQIFLPHSVTAKLVAILLTHLKNVENDTKRKILPDNLQVELQTKGN